MKTTPEELSVCAVGSPSSRRFYVHERSLGALMVAQPQIRRELTMALALSAASRGVDHYVQDRVLFDSAGEPDLAVRAAAIMLHDEAAKDLQSAFQCFVHLVPARHGRTEFLLAEREQISAWCYEDGYFTYATDENAAQVMYAETGSLRELRSRIRRTPEFDPALQMISGPSLFLMDHGTGTGPETAAMYRKQHARLVRRSGADGAEAALGVDDVAGEIHRRLLRVMDQPTADDVLPGCLRGVSMTLEVLRRSRLD